MTGDRSILANRNSSLLVPYESARESIKNKNLSDIKERINENSEITLNKGMQ